MANSFASIAFSAETLNAAVRLSNSKVRIVARRVVLLMAHLLQTGFRHAFDDYITLKYHGWVSGLSYRAFIAFDYNTCDSVATCNVSTGACTCFPGYIGPGTSCRRTNIN